MKIILVILLATVLVSLSVVFHAQAERHTRMLWSEEIGRYQSVYKVNVDGHCFVIFQLSFATFGVGVTSQPIAC